MTRAHALPVPADDSALRRADGADPPRQRSFGSRLFDRYNFGLALAAFAVVGLSTGLPLNLAFVFAVLVSAFWTHLMFAVLAWVHGRGRLAFEGVVG